MELSEPVAPTSPSPMKKFLPFIIIAVVILVIVGVAVMMQSSKKTAEQQMMQKQNIVTPTSIQNAEAVVKGMPEVKVSNWSVKSDLSVNAPTSAQQYTFHQNLNNTDFLRIGNSFFPVTAPKENQSRIMAFSTVTGASMLYMQKGSGSYLYESDGGVSLPAAGASEQDRVTSFVQGLFKDTTLQTTAAFDNTDYPGVRYYELHRNKNTMGLPVLNIFGLMNIPDTTPLSSVNLANPADVKANPRIVNTTDNSNGKARANEFNTVTVGVKGGKVISIASNMRPLSGPGKVSNVIPLSTAISKLEANRYDYLYTSPVSVTTDHATVYPNGKGTLVSATVTDATIAYVEELPVGAQEKMIPYYIFRGSGPLASGATVRFVAAVPALSDSVLGAYTSNGKLLAQDSLTGVPVGSRSTQQQGTLKFVPHSMVAVTPGTIKPMQCNSFPSPQDLRNVVQDPVTGIIYGQGLKDQGYQWSDANAGGVVWYVITQTGWNINDLQTAFDAIERATKADAGEDAAAKTRRWERAIEQFESRAAGCPVQITGATPSIFLHSDASRNVEIQPANVVFASPVTGVNGWNVSVTGDTITMNGSTSESLYYEYKPVTFTKPQEGWVVARNEVGQFAAETAKDLGLNEAETYGLRSELNHAVTDLHSNASTLFIGLVSENELNSKVPLNVKATGISVQRVHFYVSAANGETVTEPELQPVHRSSFSLLELGASAQ